MAGRRGGGAAGDSGARLLDEAVLRRLVEDLGPGAVAEVYAVFLQDAPRAVEAMRAACTAEDTAGVARSAHRLKSACGFVGVKGVSALCGEIEGLARDGRLDQVASGLDVLSDALERGSKELTAVVERHAGIS